MACCIFTLAADARERLAAVLRALLIAQLIISLCMLVFCYNAGLRQVMLLKEIHKLTAILLYGLIIFQAYAMKLHYTSGLRLLMWLPKFPQWSRSDNLTWWWTVTGSMVAINGILVTAACYNTTKELLRELSKSLRIGISQYLTEPIWKRLLDNMQVELGCCGIDKPTDWHEIPWINMDFLNEDSDLIMKLAGADGKILPPVTPYSCCTPRVLAACYHDPLQQEAWREPWGEETLGGGGGGGGGAGGAGGLVSASLHARGCVEALRAPVTRAVLGLKYFLLLSFILQIFIVILCQVLRTSVRDAVLSGDAGGAGRGFLFGDLLVEEEHVQSLLNAESNSNSSQQTFSVQTAVAATARRRRPRRRSDLRRDCYS